MLAYDEETGRTGSYTVTEVWVHEDGVIEYLEVGGETVETTPEHPFYTRERGWVAAGFLREGERVRRADGGYGEVGSVRLLRRAQPIGDLIAFY